MKINTNDSNLFPHLNTINNKTTENNKHIPQTIPGYIQSQLSTMTNEISDIRTHMDKKISDIRTHMDEKLMQ